MKKITVEVDDTVHALLEVLTHDTGAHDVAEVVAWLIDHVQQGVYRPGSWERPWLCQAFGDEWLDALEPGDPVRPPGRRPAAIPAAEGLQAEMKINRGVRGMDLEEFARRGRAAQATVDSLTPSPYRQALEFIELHPGTGSATCLAKLLLSLWNDDAAFAFRECTRSLDETRMALAVACVVRFASRGEDSDLVDVGYRVHALEPKLWELGMAGTEAKRALRAKWEQERRERAAQEDE